MSERTPTAAMPASPPAIQRFFEAGQQLPTLPEVAHSLQDAAALIGLAPLRSLALGACLAQAFPRIVGFDRLRFWRLNLARAGCARWLAGRLDQDTDSAEVAGLPRLPIFNNLTAPAAVLLH